MSSTVPWAAFLQPEDPVSLLSSLQFPMQTTHTPGDSHWASTNSYSSPSAQSILTSLYTSTTTCWILPFLACVLEGCFLLAQWWPSLFLLSSKLNHPFFKCICYVSQVCRGVCVYQLLSLSELNDTIANLPCMFLSPDGIQMVSIQLTSSNWTSLRFIISLS